MGLTYGLILPYRENRGWGEEPKEQLSPPNRGKRPQQTPALLVEQSEGGDGGGEGWVLDWLRGRVRSAVPPGATASASVQGWELCGGHKPRQETGDGKVDSTPVHVSGTASSPAAQEDSQQRGTWRRLLPGGIRETPLPLTRAFA